MDDEFDKFLRERFKKNTAYPEYHNQIDTIVENIFIKNKRKKKIFAITIPIILTTTTVFAVGYSVFNLSSIGIDDSCIEIATQNGYIYNINSEIQKYDDLGISIENFLMDDINMEISFNFQLSQEKQRGLKDIYIQDLQIYDEKNEVIFSEKEKNENKSITETSGYSKIKKDNGILKNTFFAQSDSFPKSKMIYINFNNVVLNYKNKNIMITGKWNYEISVPDKMVNRKNIEYIPISNNAYGNISIKNVKLANTGLIVTAMANDSKILDKAKIELRVDNKLLKYNSNVFERNPQNKSENTEYIYTFNILQSNAPKQLTLKVKDNKKERKIIFIKNE